jgi:hypothetical protein
MHFNGNKTTNFKISCAIRAKIKYLKIITSISYVYGELTD